MTIFLVIAAAVWGMITMALLMWNSCPYHCGYCKEQQKKRGNQEPPQSFNYKP